MKKIEILLGEKLGINVNDDITISDVIKAMSLLAAVIKNAEQTDPNIKYSEIMAMVDELSNEIKETVEEGEVQGSTKQPSDEKEEK